MPILNKEPPLSRLSGKRSPKRTEDDPLTPVEEEFIKQYLECGNYVEAMKRADPIERSSENAYSIAACRMLKQPNVRKEMNRIMDEIRSEAVATADEVMQYLTRVMRGEEKDQFGLESPLSERTRAALEIAKRTIDIDNRVKLQQEAAANNQPQIQVNLNWALPEDN